MILPVLYIASSAGKGRGVYTAAAIPADTIVEISPVIVMSATERLLLDQTKLHDYIFVWGAEENQCCMALGYIAVYNHSYEANCEYNMDFGRELMEIKTMRDIAAGEELYINYNGDWNNETPVWFEKKIHTGES